MDWQPLSEIPVFQAIGEPLLRDLAAEAEERHVAKGDRIFAEGDEGDAAYFIAEGSVSIEKRIDDTGEQTQTLSILGMGDFFGEMTLFDRSPRSASAVACGPTRLIRLSGKSFDDLLANHSASAAGFLFAVIQTVNQRVRALNSAVIVYHEVGKAIGELDRLDALLEVILRQLIQATDASSGMVLLKGQFSDALEVGAHQGFSFKPGQREELAQPASPLAKLLHQGKELLVANVSADDRCGSLGEAGLEAKALIGAPIAVQKANLGLLVLMSPRTDAFNPNHLNLCCGVARQAAQALLNIRHRKEEESRSKLRRQYIKF